MVEYRPRGSVARIIKLDSISKERRSTMVRQLRKGGFVGFLLLGILSLGAQFVSAQD